MMLVLLMHLRGRHIVLVDYLRLKYLTIVKVIMIIGCHLARGDELRLCTTCVVCLVCEVCYVVHSCWVKVWMEVLFSLLYQVRINLHELLLMTLSRILLQLLISLVHLNTSTVLLIFTIGSHFVLMLLKRVVFYFAM